MRTSVRPAPCSLGALVTILLAACGGSGAGDSNPPIGNPPPTAMPPAVFKNVVGTTPADAALGQPLALEWDLPAGVSIRSVKLDADLLAGPVSDQTNCSVTAGVLSTGATSATITIPDHCLGKTVKQVQLHLTVESNSGQSRTTTHSFAAPSSPEGFLPQRVNLPLLRITTDNDAPIISTDTYITGQISLESNVAGDAAVIGGMQIRGRGNSTWDLMPKKPYRLKLTDKQSLLGMPSSKDWVLLANYSDKTLLRNKLAMELGSGMGMPWTPRGKFVEVYHGSRYLGVYLLIENIKIAKDRVNIDELSADDDDAGVISGGYLLEVDFRQDGHTIFTAVDGLPVVFQDPEEPTAAQEAYLKGYLDQFEAVLHSTSFAHPGTGYSAYIDVDSFARWFIVNELFRNVDANMWSSCWMYKPRGRKLFMGPLWDFDLAAGNVNYNDAFLTSGWHIRNAPWFSRLFEDPAFAARVREIWNEAKTTQLPAMIQSIGTQSAALQQAQLNNFHRWPILESHVWPNYRVPGSYGGELDYLRSWLNTRIAWMDAQFNP
jgi:hypothetical protein